MDKHIIPLSLNSTLKRRQAVILTMINAGWQYVDRDYNSKDKVIEYSFKQNHNRY